jgi:hypothetical protein
VGNGRRQEGELFDWGAGPRDLRADRRKVPASSSTSAATFPRVFPIAPTPEQRVEIRRRRSSRAVSHYRPGAHVAAARTMQDFTLSADIVSRTPIRAVYSPTHQIAVARPDEHRATLGFEINGAVLENDFDLYYAVQDRDVGLSLLTHRPPGEDGYFLAMIAPRAEIAEREIAAKEVIFVFDTSGSMAGDKLRRAQAALDYMLSRLSPSDRFQPKLRPTSSLSTDARRCPRASRTQRARWFVRMVPRRHCDPSGAPRRLSTRRLAAGGCRGSSSSHGRNADGRRDRSSTHRRRGALSAIARLRLRRRR